MPYLSGSYLIEIPDARTGWNVRWTRMVVSRKLPDHVKRFAAIPHYPIVVGSQVIMSRFLWVISG
jgi:hypothetical protein